MQPDVHHVVTRGGPEDAKPPRARIWTGAKFEIEATPRSGQDASAPLADTQHERLPIR
jgi:hypothetical protein